MHGVPGVHTPRAKIVRSRPRDDPRNVAGSRERLQFARKAVDDPATLSQPGVRGVATLHAMTKEFKSE